MASPSPRVVGVDREERLMEVEFLQYSRTRPVGLVEEGDTVEIADVDGNTGDR
jgi:hypothetical protein